MKPNPKAFLLAAERLMKLPLNYGCCNILIMFPDRELHFRLFRGLYQGENRLCDHWWSRDESGREARLIALALAAAVCKEDWS
jgi:hypothetical protein